MKNKLLSAIKVIRPQDSIAFGSNNVACTLKFFLDIKQYNILIDLNARTFADLGSDVIKFRTEHLKI